MHRLEKSAEAKLAPAQLKIFKGVTFGPGLYVAEAAAGAGKTATLSYLVLKALMHDEIENVFILTATRTAKDEAVARVGKLHADLGYMHDGACPMLPIQHVRTIHSICLGAARAEAEDEGVEGVDVVSASQIKDLLTDILEDFEKEAREKHKRNGSTAATDVVDVVDLAEMPVEEASVLLKNVRAERLHSCVDVVDDSFGPTARRALAELQARLARDPESGMQRMDFDEMIEQYRASKRSIVNPGKDVLFVDEGQDLTRCQLAIIINTLRAGACVVILGDDSQGIFYFSGACNQTLRSLKEQATAAGIKVTRFGLMQNHRSTNRIVRASEALLPFSDRSCRVGVKGNGTEGAPVEVRMSKTEILEAKEVASRFVELLKEGACAPGDVVMLRHRNWAWNDPLVQEIRTQAGANGLDVPMAIVGQDASASLAGKFLCVFQVATDLERFCDPSNEGFNLVRGFLKSIRGHRGWNQKLGLKAVEVVYERHVAQDPVAIFTRYREEILSEFRLLEAKEDADQAERDARSGVTPKRKRAALDAGPSQKERNFETLLRAAGRVIKEVRTRVQAIEAGRTRLEPIVVSQEGFFASDRKKPSECAYPNLAHPLGGLAWLLLRDVVAHEFTDRDAFEIQEIVTGFDVEFDVEDADDVVAVLAKPVSDLSTAVHDKTTAGKLKFSTIHKYKGLEEKTVFVASLTPPWANPTWARRATLSYDHVSGCTNRSGERTECCAPFAAGIKRLRDAEVAEKLRLYYVGASRAKERLFLSGIPSRGGEFFSPLLTLAPSCASAWSRAN